MLWMPCRYNTFDGRLLWFHGVEGKRGLTLTVCVCVCVFPLPRPPPQKKVKVSPHLPSTPSNHSSLPSNVLYLQGIHNTCSKHKIIQYLRNHVWHSWHLWPCNLPKTQNKFILIIIWSVDNKTQHNTARECIHVHRHTSREEERCITMLLEKSDKPCTEWIFRYVL